MKVKNERFVLHLQVTFEMIFMSHYCKESLKGEVKHPIKTLKCRCAFVMTRATSFRYVNGTTNFCHDYFSTKMCSWIANWSHVEFACVLTFDYNYILGSYQWRSGREHVGQLQVSRLLSRGQAAMGWNRKGQLKRKRTEFNDYMYFCIVEFPSV